MFKTCSLFEDFVKEGKKIGLITVIAMEFLRKRRILNHPDNQEPMPDSTMDRSRKDPKGTFVFSSPKQDHIKINKAGRPYTTAKDLLNTPGYKDRLSEIAKLNFDKKQT